MDWKGGKRILKLSDEALEEAMRMRGEALEIAEKIRIESAKTMYWKRLRGRNVSASIIDFIPATGVYYPGQRVCSRLRFKNTGNVRWTFYISYSVQDGSGKRYNIRSHAVTLDPGEVSSWQYMCWDVPRNPVTGWYKVVMVVWKTMPEKDPNAIQLDFRERANSFRVLRKEDFAPELASYYSDAEYVGGGGFGRVFKARRRDGKIVAVKIPVSLDREAGKSFIRELEAWKRLRHRNIIKLYDYNILPIPYLEMEYADRSLEDLEKPMDVGEAARIILEVAEGLKYAHMNGIIHGDLKPQNILLLGNTPKITDWGLAKFRKEDRSPRISPFTPLYAAPEQLLEKFGEVDERTDIWQLGAVFYELVTGRPPFYSDDMVETMHKIISEKPVEPGRVNPEARSVEHIIMKCLEKSKDKRYQSVEELQRDLAEYLKINYNRSLDETRIKGDLTRSRFFCAQLILLSARYKDYMETIKYLSIFKDYACEEERRQINSLIEQINIRMKREIAFDDELKNRIETLVYNVMLKKRL
ncbi:serine/threonine protein kinase [Staphylothermus hellenicus]|uniref:non-specific serine/threonine protein kinase n=1 Tax=Staphylothermus hellenicus (strain DSM 12710 / JCM 10830 / BK20S6-10-b1 / P8) TaxID=591019 RepID=D7DBR7_STAHD|nr:serine/threonine-protein kinase [Staphylothermus hellenicus]ADI31614.1 serine/threonine protein kinase [Staphylothermus hellenicus DSM 12710]